jgi:hypothetical protein
MRAVVDELHRVRRVFDRLDARIERPRASRPTTSCRASAY